MSFYRTTMALHRPYTDLTRSLGSCGRCHTSPYHLLDNLDLGITCKLCYLRAPREVYNRFIYIMSYWCTTMALYRPYRSDPSLGSYGRCHTSPYHLLDSLDLGIRCKLSYLRVPHEVSHRFMYLMSFYRTTMALYRPYTDLTRSLGSCGRYHTSPYHLLDSLDLGLTCKLCYLRVPHKICHRSMYLMSFYRTTMALYRPYGDLIRSLGSCERCHNSTLSPLR